jgi:hypothetical protein
MRKIYAAIIALLIVIVLFSCTPVGSKKQISSKYGKKWTVEQVTTWSEEKPWLRGCNFIPSTAVNQLEM